MHTPTGNSRSALRGQPSILAGPTDRPGPWVIERVLERYRSLEILAGGLALFVIVLPGQWPTFSSGCVVVALCALAAVALLLEFLARTEVRRIERSAVEYDNSLCLICGYCLKHLPETHMCPECGTQYDLNHVVAEWQAYFISRKRKR